MRPPVKISRQTEVTTLHRHAIKISGAQIIDLLRGGGFDVPDNAAVTVAVPGGGDWSNTTLDLNCDSTVQIAWEIREAKKP